MRSVLLWTATALCLCAPLVFCYTNPEGIRLLQDLRAYKGDEAPASWVGPDPCGSQWDGIECSPEGRVLNVALPSWLPHRTLLQALPPLSHKAVDTVKTAVQVAGIVGQTSDAISSTSPAAAQDFSGNVVAPTTSAIQGSLDSLLQPPQLLEPASLAAPSPLPPHLSKASTAASKLAGVPLPSVVVTSPTASVPSGIGSNAPAPGGLHLALAPSTAPHSQPLPAPESIVKPQAKPAAEPAPQQEAAEAGGPEANPGEALVELLVDLEAIKAKLAEQGVRRRLTALWWQVPPPPPPFPPPPINHNPPSPMLAPQKSPVLAPTHAQPPAQPTWPTPLETPLAAVEGPAAAQPKEVPNVIEEAAKAPKHTAINPQLLPQGGTDISALQQVVDSNKEGAATSFGRRLLEYYSFGSPAPAPFGRPSPGPAVSNPFILAPESAPTGEPVEVFHQNADGSITFTLPQGHIGDFVLPQITGSFPAKLKKQVVPQPIPVGRKLMAAQWWQVPPPPPPRPPPPPPPPFPPPPISPPPPPGSIGTPTVKPVETLLSFPDAQTSTSAAAEAPAAEGTVAPGPAPAQYEDALAPDIAPAGEGSPGTLQYDLPALKIGPVTLPELKGLLPAKTVNSLPGRKRLSEVVPAVAPAPSAGPSWEILAPELAPTGEASPNGDFILPAFNLGAFHLPKVNLGKLPPKKPLP